MLVFAGTRTVDVMGVALRLSGFEIRDCIVWLYGQGFPKSHDVSKAIDRAAGAAREIVGARRVPDATKLRPCFAAISNDGDGSPSRMIPVTVPATEDASRWEGWGTALKPAMEPVLLVRKSFSGTVAKNVLAHGTGALNIDGCRVGVKGHAVARINAGRWPANVVLDEEAASQLDTESGVHGGASRFFYCAKASSSERDAGLGADSCGDEQRRNIFFR
mgnify:FL=1